MNEVSTVSVEELVYSGGKINLKKLSPKDMGDVIHSIVVSMRRECNIKDAAWIKLGFLWRFVVKNKLYRHYGDHIKNANDFLRELDLGVKRRELELYAQMASIFGRAIQDRNAQVPLRKLAMIAPLCKEGDAGGWLEKAFILPTHALEDEIREARGQVTKDSCLHPDDKQEVWMRCSECGKWVTKIRVID